MILWIFLHKQEYPVVRNETCIDGCLTTFGRGLLIYATQRDGSVSGWVSVTSVMRWPLR